MNRFTSGRLIGFSVLALVAVAGWRIGGIVSSDALTMVLGVVLGLMVAVPAMLIVLAKPQRVDHYHHTVTETPAEPQQQPVALIPASTHYIVLDTPRAQLQTTAQPRIEVSR